MQNLQIIKDVPFYAAFCPPLAGGPKSIDFEEGYKNPQVHPLLEFQALVPRAEILPSPQGGGKGNTDFLL